MFNTIIVQLVTWVSVANKDTYYYACLNPLFLPDALILKLKDHTDVKCNVKFAEQHIRSQIFT